MSFPHRLILSSSALFLVTAMAGCSDGNDAISLPSTTPTKTTLSTKAKFAYTANQGASLSGYSVNTSTGALTALSGFPLAYGLNPTTAVTDPLNRFLFVADIAASSVGVFSINSSTGALTQVGSKTYTTISEPVAAVVDPAGSHLYLAAQGSNAVGAYTIGSTGTLTAVVGQPFATGGTQYFGDAIVMNASGTMLYVQDQSNLFAYAVSAATGALTLVQTISVAGVGGLALDPNGAYLYAAESAPGILATYNIASSNGLLTLAKTYATGQGYTITISPTGQFAYSYENPNLVAYGVDNGTFSRIGVVPGVFALRLAVDPSGSFLYAPQACSQNCPGGTYNVINEFAIGNNGSLTSVAGSPVSSGTAPYSIAFTTQ